MCAHIISGFARPGYPSYTLMCMYLDAGGLTYLGAATARGGVRVALTGTIRDIDQVAMSKTRAKVRRSHTGNETDT